MMDMSPVQSSAKCGSDFSIERILSGSPSSSEGRSADAPSWLCCTRYQPPRLPRASGGGCRSRRSGRHARVPFTGAQAAALEAAYARAPYLAPPALRALAAALQLRDDRIKIWFQNRRARERREKSSTITPPREVALPPSAFFKPQGSMTPGKPSWHQPTSEHFPLAINTNFNIYNSDTSTDASDLTTSRDLSNDSSTMDVQERPYTPLDVETVED